MFSRGWQRGSKLWSSARKVRQVSKVQPFGFNKGFNTGSEGSINYMRYLTPLALVSGLAFCKSENKVGRSIAKFSSKIIQAQEEMKAECEATQQPDLMKSRVNIIQLPANYPCEDRFDAHQLKKSKGYSVAVYDGKFLINFRTWWMASL